jgi:hypothetical protein
MVPTPTENPLLFAIFGKICVLQQIKPASINAGEKAQKFQAVPSGIGAKAIRKPAMAVFFTQIMGG